MASPRTASDDLNLKQVARLLDVHYMTAYRYVRHGKLPARREGPIWVVDRADAEAFRAGRAAPPSTEGVDWVARLITPLAAGDEVGAWSVVRDALSSGHDLPAVHLDLVAGALASIGSLVA